MTTATATTTRRTTTPNARAKAAEFLGHWERLAGTYFWTPPRNASGRRAEERRNSYDLDVTILGVRYTGSIRMRCSCHNVYVTRELLVDGEPRRITALKKALA